jgi:hypothetical protein
MIKTNVTDFFKNIGSTKTALPLNAQKYYCNESLYKLTRQEYTLRSPSKYGNDLIHTNKIIFDFMFHEGSAEFYILREIPKKEFLNQDTFYVNFDEIKMIKSDSARILHHVLCAHIAPGEISTFTQIDLEKMLGINSELMDVDGREEIIQNALYELVAPEIDWKISYFARDACYSVLRKKF